VVCPSYLPRTIDTEGKVNMKKRDEYVAKMKAQLDEMNGKIDELAVKSKNAKKELQAK
jgi:hypothetical protein